MIDLSNKNFCPAAWTSLYVEPNGKVDYCCVGHNNLGNLNDVNSVINILHGEKHRKVQQDMLDDRLISGCAWCNKGSNLLQRKYLEQFPDLNDPVYQVGSFNLRYLDARWSNTCNLACVYCSENCSSLWAQELGLNIKIERDIKNNFLQYVLDNVETLEEVYLAGGEPLLMKENELLLEALSARNPNCRILVNTNLLNLDTKIYQLLIGMPNVTWLVSFEAIGAEYEYLRYPGKWTDFEHNLMRLKQDVVLEKIQFNMVFLSLNVMSFWDTIDWAHAQGFKPESMALSLYHNGVFLGPFAVQALDIEYRNQVIKRMQQKDYTKLTGYQNIADCLANPNLVSVQFVETLKNTDARRNLNSRQIFPDVYKSIESNP